MDVKFIMGLADLFKRKTHREKYEEAEKDLNTLYNEGHEDALKLNKKYNALVFEEKKARDRYEEGFDTEKSQAEINRLRKKLVNTSKKLFLFERDELGKYEGKNVMGLAIGLNPLDKENTKTKKNIGTMVGALSIFSFIFASVISTNITGNVIGVNVDISPSGSIFLAAGLVFGVVWLILRR